MSEIHEIRYSLAQLQDQAIYKPFPIGILPEGAVVTERHYDVERDEVVIQYVHMS